MYKNIAVVALTLLIGGGIYSIIESGGVSVLHEAYTNDSKTNMHPPSTENIVGLYSCTERTGCKNKYLVLFKDDMTAELLLSSDTGVDNTVTEVAQTAPDATADTESSNDATTSDDTENSDDQDTAPKTYLGSINDLPNIQPMSDLKKGTWSLVRGNVIILTLTDNGDAKLATPQKIIINKIDTNSLSRISYNKTDYKDMTKPVFLRENY
jgi:hypothetical protein